MPRGFAGVQGLAISEFGLSIVWEIRQEQTMMRMTILAFTLLIAAATVQAQEESNSPIKAIVGKFMQLDEDGSGGVSFDEYMRMVRERAVARYRLMDRNHDGEVSPVEYEEFWKERRARYYRLKQ